MATRRRLLPLFCFALFFVYAALGAPDPYSVLGVAKSASVKEIRARYRKLALEFHPDKNPKADAAKKFSEVADAWEILGDVDKRRQYDQGGQRQFFQGGGGFHGGGFGFGQQQQQQRSTEDLYVNAPLITRLTDATFTKRVAKSATHWAINYYATWCGHCVQLAPHWKKAALKLSDEDVELGAVNCAVERVLCARHGVQSFPTIKLFVVPPAAAAAAAAAAGAENTTEGNTNTAGGGGGASSEPRATVYWTSYPSTAGADADGIADWVRDSTKHAMRARFVDVLSLPSTTPSPGAPAPPPGALPFDATVLQSRLLWLVLFVARESAHWCPACAAVETAFLRLSAEFPRSAKIGFATVNCAHASGRDLCVQYGMGQPYTTAHGNFPQVLGFRAGSPNRKRFPEKMLPSLFQFASQAVERIESLEAPLRLAVGMRHPEAGAARWRRLLDAGGRTYYYEDGATESVWAAPKGWDADGPESQTILMAEEEEEEEEGEGTTAGGAAGGSAGAGVGAGDGKAGGGAKAGQKGHGEL